MYQEVYNFSQRPFTMAPYVEHFFGDSPVKRALDQINDAISRDAGPAIFVGNHGTGKSLLLALLADQYRQQFKVVSLSCGPMTERRDLLQAILFELKQPYRDLSEGELRLSLIDYIKPTENCPNGLLLLIDDAQTLTPDLIDELRLVTNFVRDGKPRVRLVMGGTSRLEEVLTEPKLEPFNQRISARCYLENLCRDETRSYIHEHITRVGGDAEMMFDQQTCDAIHEATCGCPRFINQLCEQSMIVAATHGMLVVEQQMVSPAWAQVQGLPTTESATVPALSDQEDWTVIEFGSLDDDDAGQFEEATQETAVADSPSFEEQPINEQVQESSELISSESMNEGDQWDDLPGDDPYVAQLAEPVLQPEEVVNEFTNDSTDADTESHPVEPAEYVYEQIDAETDPVDETGNDLHSIPTEIQSLNADQEDIWDSAGIASEPIAEFVEPIEVSEMSDAPVAHSPTETVTNPFEEAFESEEPVAEGISQFVATQNESSMQLSGDQLDQLPPDTQDQQIFGDVNESSTLNSTSHVHLETVEEAESLEDVSTSNLAELSSADPEALFGGTTDEIQQVEAFEYSADDVADAFPPTPTERQASETDHWAQPDPSGSEAEATHAQTESSEESFSQPVAETEQFDHVADSIEVEQSLTSELTAEEQLARLENAFAAEPIAAEDQDLNAFEQTETNPSAGDLPATTETTGGMHEHQPHEPTPGIQSQAEQILNSIQFPEADRDVAVPHETTEITASETTAEQSQDSLDNVELSEAQQILNEILEQKSLVNPEGSQPDTFERSAPPEPAYPESVPMTQPISELAEKESNKDNSDVLVFSDRANPTTEPDVGTTQPDNPGSVSIGRAERMDYERLFEQLRDIGNKG